MSLVNLLTRVDVSMVAKLPTVTIKLANGQDMLVVDGNLNGDILAALLTWNSFNKNHSNHDGIGMAVGGQGTSVDSSVWQELFIKQVLMKGIAFLVELCEAAVHLELWPMFELCSKALSNQIADKDDKQIKQLFNLSDDDESSKLSAPCIKGFLKYLSIEKRLELDSIELKEWQQASYSLWSEQKVLRFGNGQDNMVDCKHTAGGFDEANLVVCTKVELDQNLKNIELNDERKCPERFLDIVRKCSNIEKIMWDADFGEMADPEFAYVLKMSCPQLEHVQGLVRKKFIEYQICPASFIHVFKRDKNITCYHVNHIETFEAEQKLAKIAEDAKNSEMARLELEKAVELAKIKKQQDDENERKEIILKNEAKESALRTHLRANVTKFDKFRNCNAKQMVYLVNAKWYQKYESYVLHGSVKPDKVDNVALVRCSSQTQLRLKHWLKVTVDYVAVSKRSWDIIEANFGADHVISRPVIKDSRGLSLGLIQVVNVFPKFEQRGYYAMHTSFNEILTDVKKTRKLICDHDFYCRQVNNLDSSLIDEDISDGDRITWSKAFF